MPGPLAGLCICYGFGILLGAVSDFTSLPLFSILLGVFTAAGFTLLIKKYALVNCVLIYLCLFLLGAVVVRCQKEDPLNVQNVLSGTEGRKLDLEGVVASEPEAASFILRAEEVLDRSKTERFKTVPCKIRVPVRGLVLVRLNFGYLNCRYGDRIRIRGYLYMPHPPQNPGQFDYRNYLARKKIYVIANVFSEDYITVLGPGRVNPLTKLALGLKRKMEIIVRKTMDPPQRFFLESVLLGNRRLLPGRWKEIFAQTGTAHLISISGLHVGFVLAIFLLLFKTLNLPPKITSALTILVVVIYCLLTGSRPPAVRASIMAVMILAGTVLNRPVRIWNSLFTAAFIILIINPLELFDPGFQMSFLAVWGIIYISPRLERIWNPSSKYLKFTWKTAAVIVSAQLAVLPPVAYYFNIFSPVAFFANFIVVPILGLVIALGFSACALGIIWIDFAFLFNAVNWLLITVLFKLLNFFNSIPGSYIHVPSPPVYMIIFYYIILFSLVVLLESHCHSDEEKCIDQVC